MKNIVESEYFVYHTNRKQTLISRSLLWNQLPKTVHYIPNFITVEEEEEIINKVYSVPKPKWTQLLNRRLQNWGGIPHEKGMIPEKIPNWLQNYIRKVIELNCYDEKCIPNHVLINEYLPNQGIMPHLDGPLFYPVISTISCGSHTLLHFYSRCENDGNEESLEFRKKKYTLLLERRSLLVLQHDMYTKLLHGIEETDEDKIDGTINNLELCSSTYKTGTVYKRGTRISLTIRHVPKCSKFKLFLQ